MRTALAVAAVVSFVALPAIAQERGEGRGGQFRGGQGFQGRGVEQLSPKDAEKAWTLQARTVSDSLALEESSAQMVAEAYLKARSEHGEEMTAAREKMMEEFRRMRESGDVGGGGAGRGGGGGNQAFQEMRERMDKITTTHRETLKESLAELIADEEAMTTAMATLGSFNGQWDRMVHTVAGFDLDEVSEFVVLGATLDYIAETTRVRESGDRESMRDAMGSATETLTASVDEALTDEQMEEFTRTFRRRGRGGFGGGAGGPEFGGGGGGRIID